MQKNIWILADDRMGNVNQLLGIVSALGWPAERKNIAYDKWVKLPNLVRGASLIGIDAATRDELVGPWPDVVLSAGRRSFPVARWVKKMSGGHTRIVHVMNPGAAGFSEADIVVLPKHDGYTGRAQNVIQISGAPHAVTKERLATERLHWAPILGGYPAPRLSLIVGGATKDKPFTAEMAAELVHETLALKPSSVMVTTSRRTPAEVIDVLKAQLPKNTFFYQFGDKTENPYFGLLSWADMIVVTGDSISMCSECCATGVPVYIFAPSAMMGEKHKRFHADLYQNGYAAKLGERAIQKPEKGYSAAEAIAVKIKEMFKAV